jgi:hypothetical protein
MDMQIVTDHPAQKLIVAVNCYIGTSDQIGVGQIMVLPDGREALVVLYEPRDKTDTDNYGKLRLRLREIEKAGGPAVQWNYEGKHGKHEVCLMKYHPEHTEQLTDALFMKPSAEGWGSTRPLVVAWLMGAGVPTTLEEQTAKLEGLRKDIDARAQRVALAAGVDAHDLRIVPVQDAQAHVPAELHEVVFTDDADIWRAGDLLWYDDPTFGAPCPLGELAYDETLGLHHKVQ